MEVVEERPNPPDMELKPRQAGCIVPLTSEQRRVWNFLSRQPRALSFRVCAAAARITGPLHVECLSRSVDAVVHRHEALRTRFVIADAVPRQEIDPPRSRHLQVVDLTGVGADPEGELERLTTHFLSEKVDLSEGPLFAARLWKLSNQDYVFFVSADHIISDNASNKVLTRDIWALYYQAVNGQPLSLPVLPLQFPDYAVWQQARHAVWRERHDAYWQRHLSDAPCVKIPVDVGVKGKTHAIHGMRSFSWGRVLTAALRDVAQRERILLPLVALTLYAVVMSRWFGQRDFICPIVLHGRHGRPELKDVIGFFAGEAYMRMSVDLSESLRATASRVCSEFDHVCKYQDLGRIPDLIFDCSPEVAFNWQTTRSSRDEYSAGKPEHKTLTIKPTGLKGSILPETAAPFFYDTGPSITVIVHYRANLVDPCSVDRFGHNLRLAAESYVANPDTRIASIPLQ